MEGAHLHRLKPVASARVPELTPHGNVSTWKRRQFEGGSSHRSSQALSDLSSSLSRKAQAEDFGRPHPAVRDEMSGPCDQSLGLTRPGGSQDTERDIRFGR